MSRGWCSMYRNTLLKKLKNMFLTCNIKRFKIVVRTRCSISSNLILPSRVSTRAGKGVIFRACWIVNRKYGQACMAPVSNRLPSIAVSACNIYDWYCATVCRQQCSRTTHTSPPRVLVTVPSANYVTSRRDLLNFRWT